MRSDVIKSINLFGDNAFDSIASWGSDNESVSDIVEILEHLKNLSNLNKNNETLIIWNIKKINWILDRNMI